LHLCRAGELTPEELERLMTVVANPRQFKVPDWFLNRKKDYKDGRFSQVVSNALDMKLRDDLERLKKIRLAFKHIFEPPWSASLLGPPCPWPAHQDHRQAWKDCWCLEEEINPVSWHSAGGLSSECLYQRQTLRYVLLEDVYLRVDAELFRCGYAIPASDDSSSAVRAIPLPPPDHVVVDIPRPAAVIPGRPLAAPYAAVLVDIPTNAGADDGLDVFMVPMFALWIADERQRMKTKAGQQQLAVA
ncbi:hypothetical protein EJB05_15215, partial [Eragrostis curvula]